MKACRIGKIVLYDEGTSETLDIREVAKYLGDKLGMVEIEVRGNPFAPCPARTSEFARKLASIKIQDAGKQIAFGQEPLHGEVQYEKRRITGKTKAFGVLYDGRALHRVFSELVPENERGAGYVHIFFTNRLFATWEESDQRYHARTSIYGMASIISTTGVVEAPARPREYYVLKQQYEMIGKDPLELKERFKGRFIDYDDERLTEVMKGYAMQAVFHSLTGNPFCDDKGCRLYNAHWQEDLIFAQLASGYEFCSQHTRLLER